jgi:hypothetical protein
MILKVLQIARIVSHRLQLRRRCAQVRPSAALRRLPPLPALQTSDHNLAPTLSVTPGAPADTHSTPLAV